MTARHKAKLLILKLSERTTANGCTEAEERAAVAKIGELMKTHRLRFRKPRWRLFRLLVLLGTTAAAQASPMDSPELKLAAKMYVADRICPGVRFSDEVYRLVRLGEIAEGISKDMAIDITAYEALKISNYVVEHNTTRQFCFNARNNQW